MNILGINSYFENPSVALVSGGRLVFAVEDERFTGIKYGKHYTPFWTYLPIDAMYATLKYTGLKAKDLDEIGYSYNRWDHLKGLWGCVTGKRISSLRDEISAFYSLTNYVPAMRTGYDIPERYRDILQPDVLGRIPYREWNHHLSHAASAFFCSGFSEAMTVVCDGAGENACTSVYVGRGHELKLVAQEEIPHSLGLFYAFVTRYLGFQPFADEFKVMGLAAYGAPRFVDMFNAILQLRPRGHYFVDMRRLRKLSTLIGPPRFPHDPVEQVHNDIARSAQAQLEVALEHIICYYARTLGLKHLCLAGGTFLNCVANGHIASLGLFDDIFVQPAASDAGSAIGAAALSSIRRGSPPQLTYNSMALGTAYADEAIERALAQAGVQAQRLSSTELVELLARRLAHNQICAIFRGRMEFGPRALGMRSLLANPKDPTMRDRLNSVKGREDFRPVAPIIMEEAFSDYFDGHKNRYMLFTSVVRESMRQVIPSAVHVDGTARVQTIAAQDNPFLYDLLEEFRKLVGFPVLINTSFNARGKPIVESPQDALACFFTSKIDCLTLGNFFIEKRAAL